MHPPATAYCYFAAHILWHSCEGHVLGSTQYSWAAERRYDRYTDRSGPWTGFGSLLAWRVPPGPSLSSSLSLVPTSPMGGQFHSRLESSRRTTYALGVPVDCLAEYLNTISLLLLWLLLSLQLQPTTLPLTWPRQSRHHIRYRCPDHHQHSAAP